MGHRRSSLHRITRAPAPRAQHIAIDPFQDRLNDAGIAAIENAGLSDYVQHIGALSDRALPTLLGEGRRFGMIYIDGSHLFEDVFINCHYAAQLLDEAAWLYLMTAAMCMLPKRSVLYDVTWGMS